MATKENFGKFLTNLIEKKSGIGNDALTNLKKKLEEEKTIVIENKLRGLAAQIEDQVQRIRNCRKQEKIAKDMIQKLEEQAEKIINGTDDEE